MCAATGRTQLIASLPAKQSHTFLQLCGLHSPTHTHGFNLQWLSAAEHFSNHHLICDENPLPAVKALGNKSSPVWTEPMLAWTYSTACWSVCVCVCSVWDGLDLRLVELRCTRCGFIVGILFTLESSSSRTCRGTEHAGIQRFLCRTFRREKHLHYFMVTDLKPAKSCRGLQDVLALNRGENLTHE